LKKNKVKSVLIKKEMHTKTCKFLVCMKEK
jgi:hypothetical protein